MPEAVAAASRIHVNRKMRLRPAEAGASRQPADDPAPEKAAGEIRAARREPAGTDNEHNPGATARRGIELKQSILPQ
jgi:hypothetical protein